MSAPRPERLEAEELEELVRKLRDYGAPGGEPIGPPKAEPLCGEAKDALLKDGGCPFCHCTQVMQITVKMQDVRLKGGGGTGKYLGCPACPWASPMMTVSRGSQS